MLDQIGINQLFIRSGALCIMVALLFARLGCPREGHLNIYGVKCEARRKCLGVEQARRKH